MALEQSPDRQNDSPLCPMGINGLQGILGTCGVEPATSCKKWADYISVEPYDDENASCRCSICSFHLIFRKSSLGMNT